jgi:hypothetical protein
VSPVATVCNPQFPIALCLAICSALCQHYPCISQGSDILTFSNNITFFKYDVGLSFYNKHMSVEYFSRVLKSDKEI